MKRGFIYLINKETNEIVRTFNLTTLKQDRELKQDIYNKFISKGTYTLICGCNQEIHMSIKSNYQLYHKRQADTENHDKYCPYSAFYKANTSDPGWKEDETSGTTEATLDFQLKPHFYKEVNVDTDSNTPPRVASNKAGDLGGELTLSALSKKLCMYSWNRTIDNKEAFPTDKFNFLRYIYGTSRLINYNSSRTTGNLQKIYYNHYEDKFYNDLSNNRIYNNNSCEPEGYRYVYAYLSKINISVDRYLDGIFNIECKIAIADKVIDVYFSAHKKLISEALVSSGLFKKDIAQRKFICILETGSLMDKLNEQLMTKNIVVTGLVGKRKREKSLEFYELDFFEVNKYGLYSESSFEVESYDFLCDNNILFYKPYVKIPEYNNLMPDFIIKNNSNKTIFGEIFGVSNNLNGYDERKEIKRSLFKKELNDTHKLIDLDLTTNHKIPLKDRLDINAIRNFINNDTSENILTL